MLKYGKKMITDSMPQLIKYFDIVILAAPKNKTFGASHIN